MERIDYWNKSDDVGAFYPCPVCKKPLIAARVSFTVPDKYAYCYDSEILLNEIWGICLEHRIKVLLRDPERTYAPTDPSGLIDPVLLMGLTTLDPETREPIRTRKHVSRFGPRNT
jgi:hypothetical protein